MHCYPNPVDFAIAMMFAPVVRQPPDEDWNAMLRRISQPGVACEVSMETLLKFASDLEPGLEAFPFMSHPREGEAGGRLFWSIAPQLCFCRQLTAEETRELCRLNGTPLS